MEGQKLNTAERLGSQPRAGGVKHATMRSRPPAGAGCPDSSLRYPFRPQVGTCSLLCQPPALHQASGMPPDLYQVSFLKHSAPGCRPQLSCPGAWPDARPGPGALLVPPASLELPKDTGLTEQPPAPAFHRWETETPNGVCTCLYQ